MKRFFTVLFSIILCVGCLFGVACDEQETKKVSYFTNGTHIQEKSPTGRYLLREGKTSYSIVIPENASSIENISAQELVSLFKESTSVTLPIVSDNSVVFTENSSFISIGNTTLLESAELDVSPKDLGVNGLALRTKGNSVFIIGGSEYGICYATYEFLKQTVNFEQFYKDSYSLDTQVRNIELMDYKVTELPDIKRCIGGIGFLNADITVGRRMRAPYSLLNTKIWINGEPTHNAMRIIPLSEFGETHEEWFSDSKDQLCYTAHGDEVSLEEMISTYVNKVKDAIKSSPEKPFLSVADSDKNVRCTCEACVREELKYGCCNGSKIPFINEVARRVEEWGLNDEEGKKYYNPDFKILLLAYYTYEQAPVKYDESTGKYSPVDDTMKLRHNVAIEIAPIFTDFTQDYNASINKSFYKTLRSWQALTDNITWWVYSTNFSHYMYPYNVFDSIQQRYQVYADIGNLMIMDQSQLGNYNGATAWHILKAYLQTKLAWNCNEDLNACTDRFFAAHFGEAADAMRKFYDNYRVFSVYQEYTLGYCNGTSSVNFAVDKREYWPQNVLKQWRGYVDEALLAIAPLKTRNPEKYDRLYAHVVCERASIDYIMLELYQGVLGEAYKDYKKDFIEEVTLNNITYLKEGANMSEFIANME